MTERKTFKRQVRARMAKTGERYTTARSNLAAEPPAADRPIDAPTSGAAVERATGRSWEAWFAELDARGAREQPHAAIVRHLLDLGVSSWWAQTIAIGYERARGLRGAHQRSDGAYAVSVSKTVGASIERTFAAILDEELRDGWLVDGTLQARTASAPRSARFDWEDGRTRVAFWLTPKGDARCSVAVEHERLASPDEAAAAKAAWRLRLARLAGLLDAEPR